MKTILKACQTVLVGFLIILPLTGCVYWRLNQFRNQLSNFPTHYKVETRELPTIIALNPVLMQDDPGWLTGLNPSRASATNAVYLFRKEAPEGEEQGLYDLSLQAIYEDGRMSAFQFPKRFEKVMTAEVFDEAFRGMSDGALERMQQATGWMWEENVIHIPRYSNVVYYLGRPSSVVEQDNVIQSATYQYRLEGTNSLWNPTGWDLSMHFLFEPEALQVIRTETYMGRLRIRVVLEPKRNHVEIKRL